MWRLREDKLNSYKGYDSYNDARLPLCNACNFVTL